MIVLVSPALRDDRGASLEPSYAQRTVKHVVPLAITPIDVTAMPLELAKLAFLDAYGPEYADALDSVAWEVGGPDHQRQLWERQRELGAPPYPGRQIQSGSKGQAVRR